MFTFYLKLCLIFLGYAGFGLFVWDILKMVFPRLDATKVEIKKRLDAMKVEVENLKGFVQLSDRVHQLGDHVHQLGDRVHQLGDRVCRRLDAMEVEIQNLNSPSPLIQDEPSRWVRRRRGRRH